MDTDTTARSDETLAAEARAALEAAGCTGVRIHGGGNAWWVWALLASRDGVLHEACAYSARNPATPNDPVYLAGSLFDTLRKNVAAHERGMGLVDPALQQEETPAHETHGETGEIATPGDGLLGSDAVAVEVAPEMDDEPTRSTGDYEYAPDAASAGQADEPYDAEFYEPDLALSEGADLPELAAPPPEDFAPDEITPTGDGPIAYAASDLDALVREKLGRVSQIARELKATLQDGWTRDRFAYLQNLVVRIDRGEAPDDPEARAEFLAISERSQAMSRVDAHRDALEAELEIIGKQRDYAAAVAFDPEADWPFFG